MFPVAILDPKMPQMRCSLELRSVRVDAAKSFCDWNLFRSAGPKSRKTFHYANSNHYKFLLGSCSFYAPRLSPHPVKQAEVADEDLSWPSGRYSNGRVVTSELNLCTRPLSKYERNPDHTR